MRLKWCEQIENRTDFAGGGIVSESFESFEKKGDCFFRISLLIVCPADPVESFACAGRRFRFFIEKSGEKFDHLLKFLLRPEDFSLLEEAVKMELFHFGRNRFEGGHRFIESGGSHENVAMENESFAKTGMVWKFAEEAFGF